MKNTRFMEVMFSNTDEELAKQVDSDIKKAVEDGEVDTEEIKYMKTPDGNVAITDKESGEVTIAEKDPNEADTYNLIAVPDGQLEKYLHPSDDGVTPGAQVGAPDEKIENHIGNGAEVCPECGQEQCVCENEGDCGEAKQFSEVTSDNQAWQRIFSMPQEFCDYLFSEVIESEDTSVVGDLKVEKNPDEENSVIVTSESTGDQVKVTLSEDNMEVTELNSKNFCGCPKHVVGVQPYDHFLVDTQAATEEAAIELKRRLEEDGVEAVQIFDNQDDAREYAIGLLKSLGADPEEGGEVAEPEEQKEFSEYYGADSFYTHSYSTSNTVFMSRLFSEHEMGIAETRDAVEDAIHGGKEIEIDGVVVTPLDAQSAIIADGDEMTRAILTGEGMILVPGVDENGEEIEDKEGDEEGEEVYTNEEGTKCFSSTEDMTDYMIRLFSEEAEEEIIEEAIEKGKQIENESEIVTPVNDSCAIIEDKATGEFTKAEILDDDKMEVTKISEDEADSLTENLKVAKAEDDEEAAKEDEEGNEEAEEKEYSMTAFMTRLFSEDEAAENTQCIVESAIEEGVELENDTEIVTPVDNSTAIVEDKETGEFTKVTIADDDRILVSPISTEEAEALTEDIRVDTDSEEVIEGAEEKEYSANEIETSYMTRLFSEEAEEADIEKAIAEGEVVENETEVITPVDETIAVIKDKENGEYTKAVVMDEDHIELTKISEEDAEDLMKKEDEEPAKEEDEKPAKEEDKAFSTISKFFSEEVMAPAAAPAPEAEAVAEEQHSVEEIEDKAAAAIQSIQAAAEEAAAQIATAKAAPAQSTEPEIKEAQFSEKTFSQNDILVSWLKNK